MAKYLQMESNLHKRQTCYLSIIQKYFPASSILYSSEVRHVCMYLNLLFKRNNTFVIREMSPKRKHGYNENEILRSYK